MKLRVMNVSDLITALEDMRRDHGNLKVYFGDGYDRALATYCVSVEENTNWEGAPKGKAIYLS